MLKDRVAIIGAGVTGLSAAWLLHKKYDVTLFEKSDYIGGHTNTVQVQTDNGPLPVDTGFIVYNEKNYPNLVGLFAELEIETQKTDMSFAFSLNKGEIEYSGSGISGLFAQRKNWLSPQHWRLLQEIVRFNRTAHDSLTTETFNIQQSLKDFLDQHQFSEKLRERYLLPMGAAIWSCPVETMLQFPVGSFLRFFANHGLIDLKNRPQWRTVTNGSSTYVSKMLELMGNQITICSGASQVYRSESEVIVDTVDATQTFDKVIFACHADQALDLLQEPSSLEQTLLGSFDYEKNHTYLHTDTRLMPKRKKVWSSWNYLAQSNAESRQQMTATYWMNHLQQLQSSTDYLVTLNPYEMPRDEHIITEMTYEHPVFDQKAVDAQGKLHMIQGLNKAWFCGSYTRYGFHEDALMSAVNVCRDFGVTPVWDNTEHNSFSEPSNTPLSNSVVTI